MTETMSPYHESVLHWSSQFFTFLDYLVSSIAAYFPWFLRFARTNSFLGAQIELGSQIMSVYAGRVQSLAL